MGQPWFKDTTKYTDDGFMDLNGHKKLPFAASSMQGWKRTMEDTHIAKPNLERSYDVPEGTSLYAVFDGHSGKEVALFCVKYYVEVLLGLDSYKAKRYKEALVESFYELDKIIADPEYTEELRVMSGKEIKSLPEFDLQSINDDIERDDEYTEGTRQSLGCLVEEWDKDDFSAKDICYDDNNSGETMKASEETLSKCSISNSEAFNLSFKTLDLSHKLEGESVKAPEVVTKSTTQPPYIESFDKYFPTNAGTTACVVLIIEGKIYVANAGNSRAVLCRGKKAYPLSFDHKPLDTRERNRIEAAGGWVSNLGRACGYLKVSRCVGDLKYKQNKSLELAEQIITAEPDVEVTEITEKDLLLVVASDGVWDVMTNDEMVNFISKSLVTSAKQKVDSSFLIHNATEEILDNCLVTEPCVDLRGGTDNMTAIIVCLRPLEEVVSAFWC